MTRASETPETDSGCDRQRNIADHFAGVAGDYGSPQNSVRALFDVYLYKAFVFAVDNRAIHLVRRHRNGLNRYILFARLLHVHPYMGDFRIGISAPGNRQFAQPLSAKE